MTNPNSKMNIKDRKIKEKVQRFSKTYTLFFHALEYIINDSYKLCNTSYVGYDYLRSMANDSYTKKE